VYPGKSWIDQGFAFCHIIQHGFLSQVAAMQPMCVRTEQVPEAMLAEEKRILAEQAVAEGKSGPIVDRIIQGRLKRFYEEHVLLSQSFILEDKATVADVIRRVSQEVGAEVIVDAFAVLKVGAAAQGSGALH
jgi:elongation factor Ts